MNMKERAISSWIERMHLQQDCDVEKILNQIHREEYNFHKPKKSLRLKSDAVEEIISDNLFAWVVPLSPKVLEDAYYYAYYIERHLPSEEDVIQRFWSYPGIQQFKDGEIININAKAKEPCYIMLTNPLVTKLDRCSISLKGKAHEKEILERNYGIGFCKRNPIVILYQIDRVPHGIIQ